MPVFPVFLDLRARRCLVVGGGAVGAEKARRLVEAGADVLVVDPSPVPELRALAAAAGRIAAAAGHRTTSAAGSLEMEEREFDAGDCDGRVLVFACTNRPDVNTSVMAAAAERRVLACRADAASSASEETLPVSAPESPAPTFSTGALVRRGRLCVAVSSGGAGPAFAAAVRDRIADHVGDEFGEAADMIAALRERLQAGVGDANARRDALRTVLSAGLVELLRDGRRPDAAALVEDALATALRAAASAPQGTSCIR